MCKTIKSTESETGKTKTVSPTLFIIFMCLKIYDHVYFHGDYEGV